MLPPSGDPFKCHEEVLYLQSMILPKRFDIFFPLTVGCSEGLDAFRFTVSLDAMLYNKFGLRVPDNSMYSMYVCMVITHSRVWINRVRLPILLVVS